jgi:predicted enzyme related to lactoylglutathione lyase
MLNDIAERIRSQPIAGVLVHVGDVAEALRWYAQAFPNALARNDLATPGLAVLVIDGVQIELVLADEKVASGPAGSVVYWWVPSVAEALARLQIIGGELYRGPMDIEQGLSMCQVKDPWGNCIGLRGAQ